MLKLTASESKRQVREIAAIAITAGLVLAVKAASPAQAQPGVNLGQMTLGYTYYNRPGADLKAHDKDVTACAISAGSVHSVAEILNSSPNPYYHSYRLAAGRADPTDLNLAAASLENCMVVRGWRVVKLSDDEGKSLGTLPPPQIIERLAPCIGAADPRGEIVRVWNNDAARGSVSRYSTAPQRTKNGQLSLLAGAPDLQQFPSSLIQAPPSPWIDPRWPRKFLEPPDLATLRSDAGVLLVQVKGAGFHAGVGVEFNREGPDEDTLPSDEDHAPDLLFAGKGRLLNHREGDMYAFAVPSGRWRVYGLGATPTLNFCLGSPSFDIKAGEVVYAGSFDLLADGLGPDLDPAPAKAWLNGISKTVKVAAYVNGSKGPCGDNTIYALEIKGAPFEPGYRWGSLAAVPATTAAKAP